MTEQTNSIETGVVFDAQMALEKAPCDRSPVVMERWQLQELVSQVVAAEILRSAVSTSGASLQETVEDLDRTTGALARTREFVYEQWMELFGDQAAEDETDNRDTTSQLADIIEYARDVKAQENETRQRLLYILQNHEEDDDGELTNVGLIDKLCQELTDVESRLEAIKESLSDYLGSSTYMGPGTDPLRQYLSEVIELNTNLLEMDFSRPTPGS